MDTLNNFRIKMVGLLLILLQVLPARGQSFEELQKAFEKSYSFESEAEYAKAINELEKVYQAESYGINLRLGWLNYLAGLYPASSTYYEKAIQLKPFSVEAMFGYTYPLAALGNWSLVKAQYVKILEISPMNTLANYQIGLMFYNAEDYPTAFKHFEKVVNQYPFDYDGTHMLAWTSLKLGKLREAEVLFKKALLIRPGDKSASEGLELVK
jgi:tetratricopeptide (TPR) repeat protein